MFLKTLLLNLYSSSFTTNYWQYNNHYATFVPYKRNNEQTHIMINDISVDGLRQINLYDDDPGWEKQLVKVKQTVLNQFKADKDYPFSHPLLL